MKLYRAGRFVPESAAELRGLLRDPQVLAVGESRAHAESGLRFHEVIPDDEPSPLLEELDPYGDPIAVQLRHLGLLSKSKVYLAGYWNAEEGRLYRYNPERSAPELFKRLAAH